MAGIESYKTYQHTARIQVPEETYAKGMQYTNAPLSEGLCRVMVNYDLKDSGRILSPRPGLANYSLVEYAEQPLVNYTDTLQLIAGKECTEDDGVVYQQFILGDPVNHGLYAVTNPPGAVPSAKVNILSSSARYRTPQEADIHHIPVADTKYMPRHIGTFAFNNNYYYFDDDGLYRTAFAPSTKTYVQSKVTPRALTPAEAVMWGYNMLLQNPYAFGNTMLGVDSPIYIDGILPYDTSNNLALSPQVNQALHFECFYRAFPGKTYTVKWEWKELSSSIWETLKTEDITIAADKKFLCNFNVPLKSVILRVTATNKAAAADMQVMTIGFDFSKSNQGSALNAVQASYDLKDASGMAFWRNRVVLAYRNMLFFSEVNDPGYFPYPNNMEPFPENILHIMTSLDNLLVFTTTHLYNIRLSPDGLSWYVNSIQGNLNIKECDIHLIQAVKNMVFFKSGNYYYMVVPKASSTTGELTIAPVSRFVEPLLDNFQEGIDILLETLYAYSDDRMQLLYYYNFLDFEDVHNVYVFQTPQGVLVNIDLLYNTVLRVWRMYTFESPHIIKPFRQDATTKGSFMTLTPVNNAPCIQLLKFNAIDCVDAYIAPEKAVHEMTFKNYQMLDTGSRAISENLKKRFREMQLRLNNRSGKALYFYTAFYIDGDTRKAFYKYTPYQEINPSSPDYGFLTMERELVDPSVLPGTTLLGGTQEDLNCWSLDVSQFPDTSLWKVRVPFSGKGYFPRMVLLSFNQEPYELLANVWVFRQLYSR